MPPRRHEREVSREAREAASRLDAQLQDEIPTVIVRPANLSANEPFSLIIDDRPVSTSNSKLPQAVDPGSHRLTIISRRYHTVVTRFEVASGQALVLPVSFDTSHPRPRDRSVSGHRPLHIPKEVGQVARFILGTAGVEVCAWRTVDYSRGHQPYP